MARRRGLPCCRSRVGRSACACSWRVAQLHRSSQWHTMSVCSRHARLRSIGLNVSTVRYTGGHPVDKERGGGIRGWNTLRPAGSAADSAGREPSHFILRCGMELCGAPKPSATACIRHVIHSLPCGLHRENPRGSCVLCRCVCDAMPCHCYCHSRYTHVAMSFSAIKRAVWSAPERCKAMAALQTRQGPQARPGSACACVSAEVALRVCDVAWEPE